MGERSYISEHSEPRLLMWNEFSFMVSKQARWNRNQSGRRVCGTETSLDSGKKSSVLLPGVSPSFFNVRPALRYSLQ
jgi:hypothetical protein